MTHQKKQSFTPQAPTFSTQPSQPRAPTALQFDLIHHAVQSISAAVLPLAEAHRHPVLGIGVAGPHHGAQDAFPHHHLTAHAKVAGAQESSVSAAAKT